MKIILAVVRGLDTGGGIEKYTAQLGKRLAKLGHDITVYSISHYGNEEASDSAIRIIGIPAFRWRAAEKVSATLYSAVKSCFSNADIVHFHAFGPSIWSFLPRMAGKKVVVQGHGLEWKRSRWGSFGRNFLKYSEWPSVQFPHAVTVVSKVQQAYLSDKYGIEATYIPTGVDPPRHEEPDLISELGLEKGNFVLFAARLVEEKGAHHLIEAYRRIHTDKKLVIAGDAPYERTYKNILYKLAGDDQRILFPGYATGRKLKEMFSNCYLFVQPSELEGLSIGLLEAMSHGNCCLTSDIAENREALNGYGFTFKNRDVDDLKEQLEILLNDENLVGKYKEEARQYVLKHHNWDLITSQFEAFYRKVLLSS